MAAKSIDPSAGLQTQMDELDALLDRLLQLPLGSGNEPVPTAQSLKIIQPSDDLLESLDEARDDSILRFDDRSFSEKPTDSPSPRLLVTVNEPTLQSIHLSQSPVSLDAKEPISVSSPSLPGDPSVPLEEIPWIDDEPSLQAQKRENHPDDPELPVTSGVPAGARVEILIGPTCTIIRPESLSSSSPNAEQVAIPPSRLRTFFWRCNRVFDVTAGRLIPSLRRPNVKHFLGFVGLGLFAGSIYLAWHTWLSR